MTEISGRETCETGTKSARKSRAENGNQYDFANFCVQIMPQIIDYGSSYQQSIPHKEDGPFYELKQEVRKLFNEKITTSAFKNSCNQILESDDVIPYAHAHPKFPTTFEATLSNFLFGNESIFACIIANIFWCPTCKNPTADGHLNVNKYTRIDVTDEQELEIFPNCDDSNELGALKTRMYNMNVNPPHCSVCATDLIEKRAVLYAPPLLAVYCESDVKQSKIFEFDRLPIERQCKVQYKLAKIILMGTNSTKQNLYLLERVADEEWHTSHLFESLIETQYCTLNEYIENTTGHEVELTEAMKLSVTEEHTMYRQQNIEPKKKMYACLAQTEGELAWLSNHLLEDYFLLIENLTRGTDKSFFSHLFSWNSTARTFSPELHWFKATAHGTRLPFYYTFRFILFPFLNQRHFFGTVFDTKKKVIIVLDSMKKQHITRANIELCHKRYAFTMSAYGVSVRDTIDNWQIVKPNLKVDAPHFQKNYTDCGLYFATAVLHVVTGVSVTDSTFENMREKLTAELVIAKKIITILIASPQHQSRRTLQDIMIDIRTHLRSTTGKTAFEEFISNRKRVDETIVDVFGRDLIECCSSVAHKPTIDSLFHLINKKTIRVPQQHIDNIFSLEITQNIIDNNKTPTYELQSRLTHSYQLCPGENNFDPTRSIAPTTLLVPERCVFLRHFMQRQVSFCFRNTHE